MNAKQLIKELQKLEDDTEIYALDSLGDVDLNIDLYYNEYENTAGIF